jgi:ketol-acid reductoisomerase
MAEVLCEVRSGDFAEELRQEEESGYSRLERARSEARTTLLEETFRRLKGENQSGV